jgi:hypothetical protein
MRCRWELFQDARHFFFPCLTRLLGRPNHPITSQHDSHPGTAGYRLPTTTRQRRDPDRNSHGEIDRSVVPRCRYQSTANRTGLREGVAERRRVLSSDQLFLGIIKSPRTDHLQASPSKMGKILGTKHADIQQELEVMYGHYVTSHEMGGYLHQIAHILQVTGPESRAREVYLAWLEQHAPASMDVYHRQFSHTYIGSH